MTTFNNKNIFTGILKKKKEKKKARDICRVLMQISL